MKICNICKKVKSKSDFYLNRSKAEGLQGCCKECKKNYEKNWRKSNIESRRKIARDAKQKRAITNKGLMRIYLQDKKCADCGNTDSRVFEFDHLRDKKKNVSEMMFDYVWATIIEEISKCEIVCANCHRIRTYERRQKSRLKVVNI